MTEIALQSLTQQVLWIAFGLSVAFGAVVQRTHFCTMGAVADVVNFGDWTRARMWALAMGVAVIGFNGMVAVGWVEARHSLYGSTRVPWLSHAVGGLLFGVGMVLASGCGSKTLVRVGAGNLKSLVVLLVMAVSAYASLRGIVAVPRVAWIDSVVWVLPAGQDLPSLLAHATGFPPRRGAPILGLGLGGAMLLLALSRPQGRSPDALIGGLAVGGVVTLMWWVSGRLGHVLEHPLTLEEVFLGTPSRAMESLSFVAPVAYSLEWLMLFSDSSRVLGIGIVSVAGVVSGSALAALAARRFRWESFAGTEDMALHLIGAVLMGVGGVTAMGCTIGQGLSGVSTLSVGSFIATAGIVLGAWAALRWLAWRLERSL